MFYFYYFVMCSVLVPIILGLIKFNKLEKFQKLLTLYLIIGLITEIFATLFAYLYRNNLIIYDFWHILELPLILMIYSYIIYGSVNKKHFILLTSIYTILYSTEKILTFEKFFLIMPVTALISKTILLFVSIFILFKISLNTNRLILRSPKFIILIGFTAYFSIMFLMTLLYIFLPPSLLNGSAIIHSIANIFMNVCFSYNYILALRNIKNAELSSGTL